MALWEGLNSNPTSKGSRHVFLYGYQEIKIKYVLTSRKQKSPDSSACHKAVKYCTFHCITTKSKAE